MRVYVMPCAWLFGVMSVRVCVVVLLHHLVWLGMDGRAQLRRRRMVHLAGAVEQAVCLVRVLDDDLLLLLRGVAHGALSGSHCCDWWVMGR